MLANAVSGDAPWPFSTDAVGSISHVAWFFGVYVGRNAKARRAAFVRRADASTSAAILERGAPFILDWRTAFQAWAKERFHREDARIGLHKDFGPELLRIRATFQHFCPFVIDELRNFFSTNWQGFMLRRRSYFCVSPDKPRFISAAAAARILGIQASRIEGFVRDGVIDVVHRESNGRHYRALRSDSVEKLRRHLSALLTTETAGELLGVSRQRVNAMRRAGLIEAAIVISHAHRFDPKHLTKFCDAISTETRCPGADDIRLTEVKRFAFLDVIRLVRSGALQARYAATGLSSLSNLYVCAGDIQRLDHIRSSQPRDPSYVPAWRACAKLSVNNPTLVALTRAGLLNGRTEGGRLVSVSKEELDKLALSSSTSAAIAARHRTSASAVARRLTALGISPMLAALPAKKICAIWWLEDVVRVELQEDWSARRVRRKPGEPPRQPGARISPLYVSLSELAERFMIDRETLRHFVLADFLCSVGVTKAGHIRGVTRASADCFRENYVSSSEIGRRYGLAAPSVTRRLQASGRSPILEGDETRRVQCCWRRSEVADVDFNAQYITPCGLPSKPATSPLAKLLPRRPTGLSRLQPDAIHMYAAAAKLGTTSCSIRAAVGLGLLRVSRVSAAGKILSLIADDVERFSTLYVFTPKLAAEVGLSVASVSARLASLEIAPLMRRSRPVQALWERQAIAEVDLLERWITSRGELSQQSTFSLPFGRHT